MEKKETKQIEKDTFLRVKEQCLPITLCLQQSDFQNLSIFLSRLEETIYNQPKIGIESCFDYIAFPLELILEHDLQLRKKLNQPKGVGVLVFESTIKCLKALISKVDQLPRNPDPFLKLLLIQQSLFIITFKENIESQSKLTTSTEEVKLALIELLRVFFEKHVPPNRKIIISDTIHSILALFISTLLDVAIDEKAKKLKLSALETLHVLFNSIDDTSILSKFFPGTVSALQKIICGDFKLGGNVISEAINVFQTITIYVCSDKVHEQSLMKEESVLTIEGLQKMINSPKMEKNEKMDEDSEWLSMTRERFHLVLKSIFNAENYQQLHYLPRFALVKCASTLLEKCPRVLWKSVPNMVECVMMGTFDDKEGHTSDEMQKFASKTLSKFRESYSTLMKSKLISLMEERFINLIISLPRICTSANEKEKLANFVLVKCYIEVFGTSIQSIMQTILPKFSFSLLLALEIDSSNIINIIETRYTVETDMLKEQQYTSGNEEDVYFEYPKRYFKSISQKEVYVIQEICEKLGIYGDLNLFIDHFRGVFNDPKSSRFHPQSVFITSYILLGAAKKLISSNKQLEEDVQKGNLETIKSHIHILLDDYLLPENWDTKIKKKKESDKKQSLIIKAEEKSTKYKDLMEIYDYIMLSSSMLESIGLFAKILKKEFSEYLIRTLYAVLEKLGDPYGIVHQSAHATLKMMAYYGGYKSVTHLVVANSDYIIDVICHKLKYINLYPQTPQVVRALFEYTEKAKDVDLTHLEMSLVSLIEDTMESVFVGLDEYHITSIHGDYLESFFSILHNVTKVVVRKGKERRIHLFELKKKREEEEEDLERKKTQEEIDFEKEVELVKQILTKCQHFLAIDDMLARIKIIDIVDTCLDFFIHPKSHEELAGDVFPLIHILWPSLLLRFKMDRKQQVQIRVLKLVEKLVTHFGAFMYSRIVQDFYPTLKMVFEKYSADEFIKIREQYYFTKRIKNEKEKDEKVFQYLRTTIRFKLFMEMLECLCTLAKCTTITKWLSVSNKGIHTFDICKLTYPYLDKRQPMDVQEKVMELYSLLMKVDPDPVWLILMEMAQIKEIPSPNKELPMIEITSKFVKNKNFVENAKKLLSALE